uniref:Neur_chan_LBD domain-containing protein n=1 Tax=Heterorhabditis bacteriophora TaxID=37862 RepID=A0A1I7WMI2_HETBA
MPSSDQLHLEEITYIDTVAASLTDCWLRFAPFAHRLTFVDMAVVNFRSLQDQITIETGESLFHHLYDGWNISQLSINRIVENDSSTLYDITIITIVKHISMDEQCFNRGNLTMSLGWRTDCLPMKVVWGLNFRCTSSKTPFEEKRNLIKLEFELEKQGSGLDPCELQLIKEGYKCRVAMEHSKMMFRNRLKINVVKKRKLLKFTNGCHY